MAAIFKLQSFIIIIVCFQSRSSYGFKLPYDGAKIVTYGEPCQPPCYLPVTIEEPEKPDVTESVLSESYTYQPLKLNYRMISTKPTQNHQPQAEHPIVVQVPQVPQPLVEETITPDPPRGKSHTYNIQTPPPPSVPISRRHDPDFQVPPSSPTSTVPNDTPQSVKLLTGLTSKIDRVLIPACQVPSSSCCKTNTA